MVYDLLIIGGGPAGVGAGVYAARKKLKTVLITDMFGGQSLVSADVQNWIGEKSISGFDLGQKLENHLKSQKNIEIVEGNKVSKIEKDANDRFHIQTENGKNFETKTILLASGSRRKKLEVPGEKEYDGRGVVYCSICDAPIFQGKDVAVIGGGNAGLESVIDLFPYANKIYLIHRGESLKGDPVTQEKVKANPKVQIILNASIQEIIGENNLVTGLKYKDGARENRELKVQGIFVEIGIKPNSEIVGGLVDINDRLEVVVDHKTQKTSCAGIWAAGDITDALYKQNNTSVGDAIKAVLNIYDFLK